MPDPNPSERLAEIEARVEAAKWLDVAVHAREDIPWLLEREKKLREERDEAIRQRDYDYKRFTEAKNTILARDKEALADSGEASGEAG